MPRPSVLGWGKALYFHYELYTTTYMLEWWEKCIINTLMCTLIVASNYMAYHFLFKGWNHSHDDVPLAVSN